MKRQRHIISRGGFNDFREEIHFSHYVQDTFKTLGIGYWYKWMRS